MWGCWCGGVVTARPATGERTAVLIKCSRVSEGASDLIVTQVLVTSKFREVIFLIRMVRYNEGVVECSAGEEGGGGEVVSAVGSK